jgi:hypothetical protein
MIGAIAATTRAARCDAWRLGVGTGENLNARVLGDV